MQAVPRLLLVWHSRTGLARQMADALEAGAHAAAGEMGGAVVVDRRRARDASSADLLRADGFLFCAPENLASTSGEMLEFFHSNYYSAFEAPHGAGGFSETSRLVGRPAGIAVAAGSDGSGAARQMERICRGWRLRMVGDTLIHKNGEVQTPAAILHPKTLSVDGRDRCLELGGLVAATLLL
ncbi:flavoprotein-like protein [Baffinella frigidus]|nr:flavoprotein-like protein [Cryptophyta sp. CCMP2293]